MLVEKKIESEAKKIKRKRKTIDLKENERLFTALNVDNKNKRWQLQFALNFK